MANILIGAISGVFSGFGMGGGTILIFLLTFFVGADQHVAQAANLIFFIPTSVAAIWINIKNKKVDLRLAVIISICGVIGAVMGAAISAKTDVGILKRCFGIFLAIVAGHEIYIIIKEYIKGKKRHNKINKEFRRN